MLQRRLDDKQLPLHLHREARGRIAGRGCAQLKPALRGCDRNGHRMGMITRMGLVGMGSVLLAACGSSSASPGVGSAGSSESGGASAGAPVGGSGGAPSAGTGGSGIAVGGQIGLGGSAGTGVCQHELTNAACWASRDLTRLTDIRQSFFGAVSDGRYLLFVNSLTGVGDPQLRFDSQGDFADNAAWSVFDTGPTVGRGFRGGAFDGRYVYLTPTQPANNGAAQLTFDAVAGRYDTQVAFNSNLAWSAFNLTQASGSQDLTVPGFNGAAFDGRYVYFAPGQIGQLTGGQVASGNAARYDTKADFSRAASWSRFDLATVSANAAGFAGAIFDGRYLYFAPNSTSKALAARYDTQAEFSAAASWSTFETTSVNQYAGGFRGGVFDGRYVYFVPASGFSLKHTVVARYDTQANFTAAASWNTFDTGAINPSAFSEWVFAGGAFDGRYVYFVPSSGTPLMRFDTRADFGSNDAWGTVSVGRVAPTADGFSGAAFDGHYLYLMPSGLSPMVRFDAGAGGALPAANKGSFY